MAVEACVEGNKYLGLSYISSRLAGWPFAVRGLTKGSMQKEDQSEGGISLSKPFLYHFLTCTSLVKGFS